MSRVLFWFVLSVFVIDASIGFTLTPPKNNVTPGKIFQYFDYGRSIESKLLRLVATKDEEAASIAKAGWFKPSNEIEPTNLQETQHKRVYIYGMSFSNHVGKIMLQQDKALNVKIYSGPAASLNHSYAYYQYHRPHQKGDVVILGILASSVPRINTLSHMTANFESPAAYFYPRYHLNSENQLEKKQIPIDSLSELRQMMQNQSQWLQVKKTLEEEDSFYDPLLFSRNFTDSSIYSRLLKRAWGQKHTLETIEKYHNKSGFKNTERLIDVSQMLVAKFAQQVRNDGAFPYIILFNDRDFDDHLYRMLKPVLEQNKIPYYSTHNEFPATQLSNFIPDGHFTPHIDFLIAMAVLKKIYSIS